MSAPQVVYLKDYTAPAWWVRTVDLDIDFCGQGAIVTAKLALVRNSSASTAPLVLDGEELQTLSVRLDGQPVDYRIEAGCMVLADLPEQCLLETVVRIDPDRNTRLSGLYRSRDGYFTQCEAQGFRRITWFPDRPDVMSSYTVTLHADKAVFPVLLANGNPVARGDEAGGRHWVRWVDPFKKPCYLFAVVAARLDVLSDDFVTASGRRVQLAIYVEPGKLDQCTHAMVALKKAMRWDEGRFGLECDLDHYMIVAVGDFNMGAMENKGLNIFNTKYVLARPDVATDVDFENIDRVVAHEYFHNWTGNRITCRDWFQLSLKEGLTVFRDQEFGADVHNAQTARIREVRNLRAAQFPEDAGPMAHPVRPASYIEINNFYTATVYEKGAEVVRMLQTLVGREAFRRGMDEYFRRYDGQAVTCDDFVDAMLSQATLPEGFDLPAFKRWYSQPGTPRLMASGSHDAGRCEYRLTLAQSNLGADDAQPCLIPVRVALFNRSGEIFQGSERTLILSRQQQEFVFPAIDGAPVVSLLRDFSAPVNLVFEQTPADLVQLLRFERDPFAAWEAGQKLAGQSILAAAQAIRQGRSPQWPDGLAEAFRRLLQEHTHRGNAFVAEALTLPGESTLAESMDEVDPDALHAARNALRRYLAESLAVEFQLVYGEVAPHGRYYPDTESAGKRALRNVCLAYLLELGWEEAFSQAQLQFDRADNMTEQFGALAALAQAGGAAYENALEQFYTRWHHEALVVDKWLAVQAGSRLPDTLDRVRKLVAHPAFDAGNPNKIYALLRTFGANLARFHAADGSGYAFLAEQICELDARNPQVASRLARCFDRWKKFDAIRQSHARAVLEKIRAHAGLSRDVGEIIGRALGN